MVSREYPMNVLTDMGIRTDAITGEMFRRMRKMVRSGIFSTDMYRIYVKHYIEGLSVSEIAKLYDKTKNQVERTLKRIRRILRSNRITVETDFPLETGYRLPVPEALYASDSFCGDGDELIDLDEVFNISQLKISVRAYVSLKRAGINTIMDIEKIGIEGLRSVKGLKEKDLRNIEEEVRKNFVADL